MFMNIEKGFELDLSIPTTKLMCEALLKAYLYPRVGNFLSNVL